MVARVGCVVVLHKIITTTTNLTVRKVPVTDVRVRTPPTYCPKRSKIVEGHRVTHWNLLN